MAAIPNFITGLREDLREDPTKSQDKKVAWNRVFDAIDANDMQQLDTVLEETDTALGEIALNINHTFLKVSPYSRGPLTILGISVPKMLAPKTVVIKGSTLLEAAVLDRNVRLVMYLLGKGAIINHRIDSNEIIEQLAVRGLSILIDHIKVIHPETLPYAIYYGQLEMVHAFVMRGAHLSPSPTPPRWYEDQSIRNNPLLYEAMLSWGGFCVLTQSAILTQRAILTQSDIIKCLLKGGIHPDTAIATFQQLDPVLLLNDDQFSIIESNIRTVCAGCNNAETALATLHKTTHRCYTVEWTQCHHAIHQLPSIRTVEDLQRSLAPEIIAHMTMRIQVELISCISTLDPERGTYTDRTATKPFVQDFTNLPLEIQMSIIAMTTHRLVQTMLGTTDFRPNKDVSWMVEWQGASSPAHLPIAVQRAARKHLRKTIPPQPSTKLLGWCLRRQQALHQHRARNNASRDSENTSPWFHQLTCFRQYI